MNERIKELAQEAGFKVDWQHQDVQAIKMARFEKFAALIEAELQRKPLSDNDIMEMYCEPCSDKEMIEFARAIEKAHGIRDRNDY